MIENEILSSPALSRLKAHVREKNIELGIKTAKTFLQALEAVCPLDPETNHLPLDHVDYCKLAFRNALTEPDNNFLLMLGMMRRATEHDIEYYEVLEQIRQPS